MDPLSQLVINWIAVEIQQKLKVSSASALAWITTKTPWVNRFVAAFFASLTAVGIHYTWEHGVLTISGLTAVAVVKALLVIAQNYLGQKILYTLIYKLKPATA